MSKRDDVTLRVAEELAAVAAGEGRRDGSSGTTSAVREEERDQSAGSCGEFPPSTNRGGTVTWMGVHWLTGTCLRPAAEVVDVVSRHMFGLHFEPLDRGMWTYKASAVEASTKARVLWSEGRPEVAVNLPGDACEMLGVEGVLALVRELGLKLTRLDVAWDTDLLTPDMVREAHQRGDCVSFSKYHKWMQDPDGSTFYIGKRGSDPDVRLLRVYDRRGPTRVELEMHGKRAQMLWAVLDGAELADWSAGCLAYLVDFVDFRDREADKNVGRCPRLSWWEDFSEGAGRLALPLPRKAPTLDGTREWLESQVAPALSLVADSVPDATAWLKSVLSDGRTRRKPHHAAMLRAARLNV